MGSRVPSRASRMKNASSLATTDSVGTTCVSSQRGLSYGAPLLINTSSAIGATKRL
jgi:hypothetical protein